MEIPAEGPEPCPPEIEYPCRWEYKAIGRNEELMRAAVTQIMAAEDIPYTLDYSNASRTGRFCSLLLAAVVQDEAHRNRIFSALVENEHIVMVL
jgi:putative lipoic acid-binding regulatory protein